VETVSLPPPIRPDGGRAAAAKSAYSEVPEITYVPNLREVDLLLWADNVFTRYEERSPGHIESRREAPPGDEDGCRRAVLLGAMSSQGGQAIHVSRVLEALDCRVVLGADDSTETLRMGLLAAARGQAYCSLSARPLVRRRTSDRTASVRPSNNGNPRGGRGDGLDQSPVAISADPPGFGISINLAAGLLGSRRRPAHSSSGRATTPVPPPGPPALALPSPWSRLSPREAEVVLLAAKGLTNVEIGRRLFLSPETIRTYLTRAFDVLGVRRRSQLPWFVPSPPGQRRVNNTK